MYLSSRWLRCVIIGSWIKVLKFPLFIQAQAHRHGPLSSSYYLSNFCTDDEIKPRAFFYMWTGPQRHLFFKPHSITNNFRRPRNLPVLFFFHHKKQTAPARMKFPLALPSLSTLPFQIINAPDSNINFSLLVNAFQNRNHSQRWRI